MVSRTVLALIALVSGALASPPEPATILGVVEDVPGRYAGQPNSWAVRAVFQKIGHDWRAFPSDCPDQACLRTIASEYPREVTWTIAFDGRNLGRVTSYTPDAFDFYADVGLQKITSKAPVPTVGKRSREYGGFADASVYRPLVANSRPYFKDLAGWKPARLSTELLTQLRQQFRRRYPKVLNCTDEGEGSPKPWRYRDEDIRVLKTYTSRNSWSLAQLSLDGCLPDDELGEPLSQEWFVIDPTMKIGFLGDNMWLVDAGDYDNDGKSEVLFAIDADNRGGYVLFYEDFRKRVVFEFSYH